MTAATAHYFLNSWPILIGLALAGLCGCERSATEVQTQSPTNIILIVIDTLRADHLGCYGYFRDTSPNIDAFAEQAVFFEQAYAPMATTLPSHTSLFTGLYPLEHGVESNVGDDGEPFNPKPGMRPFTQLAQTNGFKTAAFVSAAPLKRVCGLDAGFDTYVQPTEALQDAQPTTREALSWLDENDRKQFFLFVHYFDPHVPYLPPLAYRALFGTGQPLKDYLKQRAIPDHVQPGLCRGKVPTDTYQATNFYDGEIRYCDHYVGQLLDSLRQRGLWDNSVIIITADHGEGLNQHDWPQHGRTWNEQVHIPLLIHFPPRYSGLPARFKPLVSLIDVFPTVLGRLQPRWLSDFTDQSTGVDVLAPNFRQRPVLSQRSARDCGEFGGSLYALTTPEWRYHYLEDNRALIFNRLSDPYELNNVAGELDVPETELRQQTLALLDQFKQHRTELNVDSNSAHPLDPKLREEMEKLGYVDKTSEAAAETVTSQPTEP